MTGSKCLLVEDEYLIRLTIAEVLAEEGFQVVEAATADEALDLLQGHPDIGLLLTDLRLPGSLDGLGLVRRARERAPDLPVVLMSGGLSGRGAADAGTNTIVLAKPFLPSEVCAAARRLIGR